MKPLSSILLSDQINRVFDSSYCFTDNSKNTLTLKLIFSISVIKMFKSAILLAGAALFVTGTLAGEYVIVLLICPLSVMLTL